VYIRTPDEREFNSYTVQELEEKKEIDKQNRIRDEVI